MTPRRRQRIQEALLDAIKQAHPGTTDVEIASTDGVGVNRTQVSRWRSGERRLDVDELVGLVRAFGAVPVLAPIAAIDGATVVAGDGEAPGALGTCLRHARREAHEFLVAVDQAEEPDSQGRRGIVGDKRRALLQDVRELVDELESLRRRLLEDGPP